MLHSVRSRAHCEQIQCSQQLSKSGKASQSKKVLWICRRFIFLAAVFLISIFCRMSSSLGTSTESDHCGKATSVSALRFGALAVISPLLGDDDILIDIDRVPLRSLKKIWERKKLFAQQGSGSEEKDVEAATKVNDVDPRLPLKDTSAHLSEEEIVRRYPFLRASSSSSSRSSVFSAQERQQLMSAGGWCSPLADDPMVQYVTGGIEDHTFTNRHHHHSAGDKITTQSTGDTYHLNQYVRHLFTPLAKGTTNRGKNMSSTPSDSSDSSDSSHTSQAFSPTVNVEEADTLLLLSKSGIRESFVIRIATPAPSFSIASSLSSSSSSPAGVLEYIEHTCNLALAVKERNVKRSNPVSATFFGTSSIMLHGTPSRVRECYAAAGIASFSLRVCHWHADVIVHPLLQAVLLEDSDEGADRPYVSRKENNNENRDENTAAQRFHGAASSAQANELSENHHDLEIHTNTKKNNFPFEHIVAIVPPKILTTEVEPLTETTNGSVRARLFKTASALPMSGLSAYYNSPLFNLTAATGYSFISHSLSDDSEDDDVRHFICEPRRPIPRRVGISKASNEDIEGEPEEESAPAPASLEVYAHCNVSALASFIADVVASFEGLISIEPRRVIRVANKFSRGLLESGKQFEEPFGKGLGLDGEGYVVAVADTGVDYDHCFFRDPNRAVPMNRADPQHRKIIRYQTYGSNEGDFSPGHGTHVAGSIAGSPFDPTSEFADFHGVLPKAKLVVWDQSMGKGEGLHGVSNFNDLFGVSYSDGARVHSNSWGSAGAGYSFDASAVDTYTSKNRYMLPIFAAGNDADSKCGNSENDLYCDRKTVISPCIAKNVLCVGASMGSFDSWKFAKLGNYVMRVPDFAGDKQLRVLKGNFGPTDPSALASVELILADPLDGCNGNAGLKNPAADVKGKLVVFVRGTCTFISKILAAQSRGAAGALIINNVNGDAIIMGCDEIGDCGIKIGSFMIDKENGMALKSFLEEKQKKKKQQNDNTNNKEEVIDDGVKASLYETNEQDPHKGEDNLSEFSSHGPTLDNRYKPEVVAVGELVISAFSDANLNSNNCDVWPTQGTSMATPLTSGLATMLLQYFALGIHVDGTKNNKDQGISQMSSSMLKAALIHAAAPLTGVFDRNSRGDWRQLGRAPTSEQGHGKPRLNYSFPTSAQSPIRVFLDDDSAVLNGGSKEYCIDYNGKAEGFAATLVWIDPPARVGAAYVLINNLNLIVTTPDGSREFHGNMDPTLNASHDVRTAGATDGFDVLNNAEKVRLASAPAGVYRVRVEGANVPSGSQQYSLMVSGTLASKCPTFCEAFPCVHGTCRSRTSERRCQCNEGWSGPRCDVPEFTAPKSTKTTATLVLEPMQWVYFNVITPSTSSSSPPTPSENANLRKFIVHPRHRDGEIDFSLCDVKASSNAAGLTGCVVRDTQCQTCGARGPPEAQSPMVVDYSAALKERTKRVLSVTAQCCYRSEVTVASATDTAEELSRSTTPQFKSHVSLEIVRVLNAKLDSPPARYVLDLAIEGGTLEFLEALRSEAAAGQGGSHNKNKIVLRSSQWSASSTTRQYFECEIFSVDPQAKTVSCAVSTLLGDNGSLLCPTLSGKSGRVEVEGYFSLAWIRKVNESGSGSSGSSFHEVLSAPHPSAVHVRCDMFRAQAQGSTTADPKQEEGGDKNEIDGGATMLAHKQDYRVVEPYYPPFHPNLTAMPSVFGLRGPGGSITKKLCVPFVSFAKREGPSTQSQNLELFTLSGSHFGEAASKGLLKLKLSVSTASTEGGGGGVSGAVSVDDTRIVYSETLHGSAPLLRKGSFSDGILQFSLPSAVLALAEACDADASSNCGLVKVDVFIAVTVSKSDLAKVSNVSEEDSSVVTTTEEYVIIVSTMNIFITSSPRIVGLGVEPVQSNEPFSLILEKTLTIPAAVAAQYTDQNYFDSSTIYKAERWFYFKGRFLSPDPRTSLAFGALLEGSALLSPLSSSSPPSAEKESVRLIRFKTSFPASTADEGSAKNESAKKDKYTYCGILRSLNDELVECMVMLSTLERGASAVSTEMPVEALFIGVDEPQVQKLVKLQLGPSGVVTGLADELGVVVPQPRVSPFMTITIIGKALPHEYTHLLVITARPLLSIGSYSSPPIRLEVLHASKDRIVARFGASVAARANQYALSVSLTTRIPLISGSSDTSSSAYAAPQHLYFIYSGSESTAYLTGLSLSAPSSSSSSGGTQEVGQGRSPVVGELSFTSLSPKESPHVLTIHGVNLGILRNSSSVVGKPPVVRLTCVVETVETEELCHLLPEDGLISTQELRCHVSPFASNKCRVDVLVGRDLVPAFVLRDGREGQLFISFDSQTSAAPPFFATAFSFDTVLLVGATTRADVIGDLADVWSRDEKDYEENTVGLFVSATPCYRPTIIGTSRIVYASDDDNNGQQGSAKRKEIVGFDITATSTTLSVAHVCLANGRALRGARESPEGFTFYTRVSLDIIVVTPRVSPFLQSPSSASSPTAVSNPKHFLPHVEMRWSPTKTYFEDKSAFARRSADGHSAYRGFLSFSSSAEGTLDVTLRLSVSSEGDFVNRVYVYADFTPTNESCDEGVRRRRNEERNVWSSLSEAHWHEPLFAGGDPFLEVFIARVPLLKSADMWNNSDQPNRRGVSSAATSAAFSFTQRLCIAVSTNLNDVQLPPWQYEEVPKTVVGVRPSTPSLAGGKEGEGEVSRYSSLTACSGRGRCTTCKEASDLSEGNNKTNDAFTFCGTCDPWFGGDFCENMCEVGFDGGAPCSGYPCLSGGVCDCGGTLLDADGNVFKPRGPACNVLAQQVALPSRLIMANNASSSSFENAVRYFPSTDSELNPLWMASAAAAAAQRVRRAMPIVLELTGDAIARAASVTFDETNQDEDSTTQYPVGGRQVVFLDVVVIAPPQTHSVSVRLHANDSRLLHPIGASYIKTASGVGISGGSGLGLRPPTSLVGGVVGSVEDDGSHEAIVRQRSLLTASFPLSRKGWTCLVKGSSPSSRSDTNGGSLSARKGCFVVIEVSTDSTLLEGGFAPAAVGLKLVQRKVNSVTSTTDSEGALGQGVPTASLSSLEVLAGGGLIGSVTPKRVTLSRLDTSTFIGIFSAMGAAVSLALGVCVGFFVLARMKALTLSGPSLMWRAVLSSLCWFVSGDHPRRTAREEAGDRVELSSK